jgi:hypothetical protein
MLLQPKRERDIDAADHDRERTDQADHRQRLLSSYDKKWRSKVRMMLITIDVVIGK